MAFKPQHTVVVIAENGEFIYGVHDADPDIAWDFANEHINDALNNEVEGSETWHVYRMSLTSAVQGLADVIPLVPNKEASEAWQMSYPDGLTVQDVANELSDYYHMLNEVPKVYMEVTDGLLSKPNYHASSVIGAFRSYLERYAEDIRNKVLEEHGLLETAP